MNYQEDNETTNEAKMGLSAAQIALILAAIGLFALLFWSAFRASPSAVSEGLSPSKISATALADMLNT